jgi:hypothetical protein
MMRALPQKTLKVVPAPLALDAVDKAPPVRAAPSPTVEYACGIFLSLAAPQELSLDVGLGPLQLNPPSGAWL